MNHTFQPAEPCINQQSDGCGGLGSWFALKTSKFLFRYEFKAIRNNLKLISYFCHFTSKFSTTINSYDKKLPPIIYKILG